MSALFTEAILDPVIKKDSSDHKIYQNYKTISNLPLVSKATEKGVPSRLTDHLAPVVQRVESTNSISFDNTYRVDNCNPPFEQQGQG